jgi:hypothetical protein
MSWTIPKTALGDKIIWDVSKIPGELLALSLAELTITTLMPTI